METENKYQNSPVMEPESKRPAFLSVLCILSFIGGGLMVLFSIFLFLFAGDMKTMIQGSEYYMQSYVAGDNAVLNAFMILVVSAASLYGAIRMWHLEKMGFWIYLVAQFVAIFLTFSMLTIFINAIFVLLYYLNYKYLVK